MKCPNCGNEILEAPQRLGGAYCKCGWLESPAEVPQHMSRATKASIAVVGILAVVLFCLFLYGRSKWGKYALDAAYIKLKLSLGQSTESDEAQLGRICNTFRDDECSVEAYSRLVRRNPNNTIALANLAMAETNTRRFKSAVQHYQAFFNLGGAGRDVMYGYAKTLSALDQTEEAIRWYYNTIRAYPNTLDPIQDLTAIFGRLGRHTEALALLSTLSEEFPAHKGRWQGEMIVLSEALTASAGKAEPSRTIRIGALRSGMHYVPVKVGLDPQYRPFLVDTGATNLVLSKTAAQTAKIRLGTSGQETSIRTADRMTKGTLVTLPEVWVGPWRITNVEAIICDNCSSLLGKSVISRFEMRFDQEGNAEILSITDRKHLSTPTIH